MNERNMSQPTADRRRWKCGLMVAAAAYDARFLSRNPSVVAPAEPLQPGWSMWHVLRTSTPSSSTSSAFWFLFLVWRLSHLGSCSSCLIACVKAGCQQVEQGGCVSEGVSHCLMPNSHLVHLLRQDAVGALVGDLGGRGATERRRHIGLKAGRVVLAGLVWARGASTRITGTRKDCPFKLFSSQAA